MFWFFNRGSFIQITHIDYYSTAQHTRSSTDTDFFPEYNCLGNEIYDDIASYTLYSSTNYHMDTLLNPGFVIANPISVE